jgi:putative transposase
MNTWGPYPTDLSDTEWEIIRELLPPPTPRTRSLRFNYRRLIDTISYLDKTGCQYRMLPRDLCKRSVTNKYLRKWQADGTWQKITEALRQQVRRAAGRDPEPSAAILDSESAPATLVGGEQRGVDGHKKVDGRKRHIAVDTLGLLLAVVVTAANVSDGRAAPQLMDRVLQGGNQRLRYVCGDGRYNDTVFDAWLARHAEIRLEVISRDPGTGFVVLPKRWIVERTFAWLLCARRLCRDYERTVLSSEAVVHTVSIRLMLRRLTRAKPIQSGEVAYSAGGFPQVL